MKFEKVPVVTERAETRSPATLVVMNLWSPFESKLEGVIARMDEHRKFVLDELQILQLESSRKAEQDAARERQFAEKQRQLEAEARKQIE